MGVRELRKHYTKCKEKAGISLENLSSLCLISGIIVIQLGEIIRLLACVMLFIRQYFCYHARPCDNKHIASPDSPNDRHAFRPEAACAVLLVRMSSQIPHLAVVLVQYVMQRSHANAPSSSQNSFAAAVSIVVAFSTPLFPIGIPAYLTGIRKD